MILYKYIQLEYLQSCFDNGIFASSLENVNDPFEQEGIRYPELYRICCLTKSRMKMLMWSYYGAHKGCCVGFDVPDDSFKPVEYIGRFEDRSVMSTEEVIESLYHKGSEWRREEEYRNVFYRKKHDHHIWKTDSKGNVFFKAPVCSVIFGFFSHLSPEYRTALLYLKDKNVEVTKCDLKKGYYAFYSNKQFDIEQELEMAHHHVEEGIVSENGVQPIPTEDIKKLFEKNRGK